MALRVGIVGASRRRQGIGQHVARHLAALGASVTAIAGSRRETAEQTAAFLASNYGLRVRAYGSLPAMLAGEALDAVAICSPDEFHRRHLLEALAAGVHVLCEKPLVFEGGRDLVIDARPIVEGFAAAGRVLMVNEQWPCTLAAFERLYPDARLRESWPREFAMLLSPDALGPDMIPNSLPHALSLLLALTPQRSVAATEGTTESADGTDFFRRIRGIRAIRGLSLRGTQRNRGLGVRGGNAHDMQADDIEVEFAEVDGVPGAAAEIRFCCRHAQGCTRVAVTMRRTAETPRPAGYAIDGRWAYRRIDMPTYRMWLDCPQQAASSPSHVPLDDPLKLLLADFVNRCERARTPADVYRDTTILTRLAILRDVHRVACGELEGAR